MQKSVAKSLQPSSPPGDRPDTPSAAQRGAPLAGAPRRAHTSVAAPPSGAAAPLGDRLLRLTELTPEGFANSDAKAAAAALQAAGAD